MASELVRVSKNYEPSKAAKEPALPTLPDLRLALNVAACDSLALVVGVLRLDEDASQRERQDADAALRGRLAALCFDEHALGRAHYVIVEGDEGLRAFDGFDAKADVFVLAPDAYGIEAKVLAASLATEKDLVVRAVEALDSYAPETKDAAAHLRAARRAGIEWETEIPITDSKARKGAKG
ncbi:hypothetical protein Pla163_00750 [Planctomycetes bacterium Pla163]|uniref:Uncharacterized protein n=1 Tax=Rohdeia mirabilis TaxID=2528008 RepID=A0A518CUS2_9BACT|nr:hypothetical protein Pla163_00750 [Planctomycetes bacterium Pla163]